MKYTVKINSKNGLNSLFKIADIDKSKVAVKPLNRGNGFAFELFGRDSVNFENVIRNTDIPFTMTE